MKKNLKNLLFLVKIGDKIARLCIVIFDIIFYNLLLPLKFYYLIARNWCGCIFLIIMGTLYAQIMYIIPFYTTFLEFNF